MIGNPGTFALFRGVSSTDCGPYGSTIPHTLYASFQMTFALMVPVLVTGAWAEKFYFSSACLFMVIWPFLVYYPVAHWIWGGGWLQSKGVLDFAGGLTIHLTSGVASLVVALVVQKRRVFKKGVVDDTTHNLPLAMIGVALIWVGWYSFNGGSALRANGQAASALLATQISACCGALVWAIASKVESGNVQITAVVSGGLAGLAGITPGSGYVDHCAGIPIGIVCGLTSYFGGKLIKSKISIDDVLDVASLQAIPGMTGSILLAFFATTDVLPCPLPEHYLRHCDRSLQGKSGVFYGGGGDLLKWQLAAVVTVIVWTSLMTYVSLMIIQQVAHLDVPPEYEEVGLDKSDHGERAYVGTPPAL